MANKVPVTIYIDDDKELESIKLRPLASKLATAAQPDAKKHGTATMKATFKGGETDAEVDATIQF